MKKILIYALIFATLTIGLLTHALRHEREEKDRYKANQTALLSDIEYYKTENGKNVASVQKLTLTNSELKQNYTEVCDLVKELNIKIKRLQSVTTSKTETKVVVKTEVRDSIVYVKGEPLKILAFDWKDAWTNVMGAIRNDSIDLNIQSTDTLIQVVHRVPHKFWFIKWGTKAIRQDIMSTNPHTNIVYSKYIELK